MQNLLPRVRLFAALAVCALCGCHKEKPAPSIDDLSKALERSAEQGMPAPTLASEQLVITADPGKAEAEAAAVLDAARKAGGVGIRSLNAQNQISILTTIPENNAGAFKALVRHEASHALEMASPSASTLLIEVLIENPAPSPSP